MADILWCSICLCSSRAAGVAMGLASGSWSGVNNALALCRGLVRWHHAPSSVFSWIMMLMLHASMLSLGGRCHCGVAWGDVSVLAMHWPCVWCWSCRGIRHPSISLTQFYFCFMYVCVLECTFVCEQPIKLNWIEYMLASSYSQCFVDLQVDEALDTYTHGECLELVHHVKYLGIWFDSLLNWDVHTQQVSNKIAQSSY